jgi:tetratricopeptide (TPR) repeat protein
MSHSPPIRFAPLRSTLVLIGVFAAALAAPAQSVRWDPPGGTLGVGQTSQISLVFEGCSPSGAVQLPEVRDLSFGRPSQSSQTSMINFSITTRTILSYPVLPVRRGSVVIPEFEVATDKGRLRVPAATFSVGDATVGRSNLSIESIAGSALLTDRPEVWAGEVFSLRYRLLIVRRFNPTGVGDLEWEAPTGLIAEPWPRPENITATIDNEPRVGLAYQTRAYARNPGPIALPGARQLVNLETGTQPLGLFTRPQVEQFLITSSAPLLTVKPLPRPAPAQFAGAVGDFTLEANLVPTAATVGEPITWTLKLSGTGNWPDGLSLPPREVATDFRVIRPQTQRSTREGTLFDGELVEDIVLIPTQPGNYDFAPVTFVYFDPRAGTYRTLRTQPVSLRVQPSAISAPAPGGAAGPGGTDPGAMLAADFGPDTFRPPAPPPPGMIPLDPLVGTGLALLPHAPRSASWLALPLLPVTLFWLALAVRRAFALDPARNQRDARRALPAAVARVQAAGADRARRDRALLAWQQVARRAWGLPEAAPLANDITAAAKRLAGDPAAREWSRLWGEAEAHLYARDATLPADWPERAAAAVQTVPAPRRPWREVWRPRHLWPLALVALGAGLATAPDSLAAPTASAVADAAPDALAAYQSGRYSVAATNWRRQLAEAPADWRTRHNLGLALAQQNRWDEAAAHWTAAFLQRPQDPAVRWHFELGLSRAPYTVPALRDLAAGRGFARVARWASPAQWQRLLVGAAFTLGAAIALAVWQRHYPRRFAAGAAWALLAVSILAGSAATAALHRYGLLARPEAALVWQDTTLRSVPTEAGEQETTPLGAGTLVLIDHEFLGWRRLAFPNGQTGWVRREVLVPFYR